MNCPAGEVAPIRTEPSGRRRASFAKAAFDRCPLRARCVAPAQGRRQIPIAREEELLIAARQALDGPNTAEHLRRTRPRIKRLLGLPAHRYGARKARYIGAAKSRLQALRAAALVNLNPIGRRLAAKHEMTNPQPPKHNIRPASSPDHRLDRALAKSDFLSGLLADDLPPAQPMAGSSHP